MRIIILPGGYQPERKHLEDAGYDLYSPEYIRIESGDYKKIPLKIKVEIPKGFVGLMFPRSSLSGNFGITVSANVVDSGYTGEIHVVLHNLGSDTFIVNPLDRIAQLVIVPFYGNEIQKVDSFEETNRGEGGFGSTGK